MNGKNVAAFVIGAVVGSAVTWFLTKTKYERKADEEIKGMAEYYSERHISEDESDKHEEALVEEISADITEEDVEEYNSVINKLGYNKNNEKGGGSSMGRNGPYVISPEEFDEMDDYKIRSFTYYADGVLEDEHHNLLNTKEIEKLIGLDSLNWFGEYEEDSVFVRNDKLKTDFEILQDMREYAKLYTQDSHSVDE